MKKKEISLVMCMLMTASLLAGCSSSSSSSSTTTASSTTEAASSTEEESTTEAADTDSSESSGGTTSEGGLKFGYTYWAASDFFQTIGETMDSLAQENGDSVIIVDAQQDQSKQISIVEDFITQGVSAVFLNPVDREGIEPALDLLNEANIPIINVDTAVEAIDKVDAFIASDNYGAGVLCGEKLIELCPDGGEVAILDYPANSACIDRVQGFKDTIEGKGFTVVAQQDAEGKPDPGLEKMQDILQANPDVVGVFCCNDQCAQGAYAAVNEAGSDCYVLGVDGTPEAKEYISEGGAFVATAAQSPKKIGQYSIETAYKILNGEEYEKEISVPTFLIDASNVDQYKDGWQ